MGLGRALITHLSKYPQVRKLYSEFGRVLDRRSIWAGSHSYSNPDPIDTNSTGDRYFRAMVNPLVEAGYDYSDASRLFVSARGLKPDEFGAYHPSQLGYTTPEDGDEEQLAELAYQYDEQFDGGFQPILRSLQDSARTWGRAIGEISWQHSDDGGFFADFIWSRDPQEFIFSPPNLPPGLYRKKHIYSTSWSNDLIKMPPGKFMFVVHKPLFNNPYGQSILRSLIKIIETWQGTGTGYDDDPNQQGVCDAWREGMKKAGFGMWLATYDHTIAGDDERNVLARENLLAGLKKLGVRMAGIFHKNAEVRAEKLDIDSQAFMDFYTMYVQSISILLCGSATALIEGKYGSYAKEESTTVREKSTREQFNALMLSSAFTYQFNRFWLHYNYGAQAKALPQLQLIPPNRIMPTTPQGQETQDGSEEDIAEKTEKIKVESEEEAQEFQAKDEGEVKADTKKEPDIYFDVQEEAKKYIEKLLVKNYPDVKKSEASEVYTVKHLRGRQDPEELLTVLKDAIIPTLGEKTEKKAWDKYVIEARKRVNDLEETVNIGDLFVSFRMTRQSAFQAGIDKLAKDNKSSLAAVRLVSRDDAKVRGIHRLWDGITLMPNDKRLEKLKCPMDFGCRCNQIPIFDGENYTLTPESEIPSVFPGETFKNYARG